MLRGYVIFLTDNDGSFSIIIIILSDPAGFFRLLLRFGDCSLLSQSLDGGKVETHSSGAWFHHLPPAQ